MVQPHKIGIQMKQKDLTKTLILYDDFKPLVSLIWRYFSHVRANPWSAEKFIYIYTYTKREMVIFNLKSSIINVHAHLYIFYSFSAMIDLRRQKLTSKVDQLFNMLNIKRDINHQDLKIDYFHFVKSEKVSLTWNCRSRQRDATSNGWTFQLNALYWTFDSDKTREKISVRGSTFDVRDFCRNGTICHK